jgi:hypothetical protein
LFILAGNGLSKQLAQLIELPVRFFELLGEKPDAFDEARRQRKRRVSKNASVTGPS